MPATERLYYNDSHLIEFEARVIDRTDRVSGWTALTLDRTAFYPTGGGQPSDTGTLADARVVECIDDEANEILHVIQGRAPDVGATVRGRIDWPRRLDHMQQHTGQHILSQAFISLYNAPTRSFRVLHDVCEIDVELTNPTNEIIERAVELANNVIWEDRQITITTATAADAARLPLRKEPSRDGELRLIEIEGFDLTPCGGTHAYRTGEVGMIAVRSWERAKGLTRIEFAAGTRALADYRRANKTARAVAALFSASRDDAAKLSAHLLEENKELCHRVRHLEAIAVSVEAEEIWQTTTPTSDGARIVSRILDGRDPESLKQVALALISHPKTIALLGSRDQDE
jgi:alanyl-tRNA synthetase